MAEKRYIAMSFLVWKTLTSEVAATALPAMEMSEAQAQIPTLEYCGPTFTSCSNSRAGGVEF